MRNGTPLIRAFVASLVFVLSSCSPVSEDAPPLILAAASLQGALDDAVDVWEKRGHPRPVISYAGTSALVRQVESGARADVFISADVAWMDDLEAKGLIDPSSRAVLASNALALIGPAGSARREEPVDSALIRVRLGSGRLAMAEPVAVPAGRYAKIALQSLGVWQAVENRIAPAENVRAALMLVQRGEAPIGITYASDIVGADDVTIIALFPDKSHPPIIYPIARLTASQSNSADDFLTFLLSEEGKAAFTRRGFGLAPQ